MLLEDPLVRLKNYNSIVPTTVIYVLCYIEDHINKQSISALILSFHRLFLS